jgi:hypothetical protein
MNLINIGTNKSNVDGEEDEFPPELIESLLAIQRRNIRSELSSWLKAGGQIDDVAAILNEDNTGFTPDGAEIPIPGSTPRKTYESAQLYGVPVSSILLAHPRITESLVRVSPAWSIVKRAFDIRAMEKDNARSEHLQHDRLLNNDDAKTHSQRSDQDGISDANGIGNEMEEDERISISSDDELVEEHTGLNDGNVPNIGIEDGTSALPDVHSIRNDQGSEEDTSDTSKPAQSEGQHSIETLHGEEIGSESSADETNSTVEGSRIEDDSSVIIDDGVGGIGFSDHANDQEVDNDKSHGRELFEDELGGNSDKSPIVGEDAKAEAPGIDFEEEEQGGGTKGSDEKVVQVNTDTDALDFEPKLAMNDSETLIPNLEEAEAKIRSLGLPADIVTKMIANLYNK